ncbi:MAG: TlyA family RNA methyltransferase, partial [Deltaproteobacteria bacterium]|nr:TlyA family RNA methyltransferase [Deltaproteobacteria bacterium]
TLVDRDAPIRLQGRACPYVSRGGLKLEKALDEFRLTVEGVVALDVGASTGGFTDCLLKRGARRVFAVDVGYGQLDWILRNDP